MTRQETVEMMPLIDFHTHTQPDRARADEFYSWIARPRLNVGTPDDLFARMAELGIGRSLVVSWLPAQDLVADKVAAGMARPLAVAEVVARWHDLNMWAAGFARANPARVTSVVGVDPLLMTPAEIEAEIAAGLAAGASGIKVAPMYLGMPPSDPRMDVVWQAALDHDVFVLSESGTHAALGHDPWGHPQHFEGVLARFPVLRLQLAHLGAGAEDVVARLCARYPHVYTDLAARLERIGEPGRWTAEEAVRVIRMIGCDRVFYATNYPIPDVRAFAETFRALPLTDTEREMVAWRNVERMLRIEGQAGMSVASPRPTTP